MSLEIIFDFLMLLKDKKGKQSQKKKLPRNAVGQACSTHSPRAICSLAQLAPWQPPAQYHHATYFAVAPY